MPPSSGIQRVEAFLRRLLRAFFSPSPRGRVWRAAIAALLLTAAAGTMVYPRIWNRTISAVSVGSLKIPPVKEIPFRLGLDLQGGAHLVYEADMKLVPEGDRRSALDGVRDVIERRVNAFGVAEPVVQTNRTANSWRLIVELAGIKDVALAIRQIGETPVLEFLEPNETPSRKLTPEEERSMALANKEAKTKAGEIVRQTLAKGADFGEIAKQFSEDTGSARAGGELGWIRLGQTVKEFEQALFTELKVGDITPKPVQTQFGYHVIQKEEERDTEEDGALVHEVRARHILVRTKIEADYAPPEPWKGTGLTGKQLKRANVLFDPNSNAPLVELRFNDEGAKLFEQLTERNIGKPIAIFLDGSPISVPTVQSKITGGTAVITGSRTVEEAQILAKRLNAGALPVPISLISEQTVGATLGQDSVRASLIAGLVGFVLVAAFMILYYRLPGLISVFSLGVYVVLVLTLFKLIPVTLTLAGIAGFILSLGMAVDANVLIFERFREELKAGKPAGQALDEGFRRAWTSIRDGNLTTLIAAAVLFWFSSSVIKGFALTLAVGVLMSMFSAIYISRTFLRVVLPWVKNRFWYGV